MCIHTHIHTYTQGLHPDEDTYTHLLGMCAKAAEAGYTQAADIAMQLMQNATSLKETQNQKGNKYMYACICIHTYIIFVFIYIYIYIYMIYYACVKKACIYIYTYLHVILCTHICMSVHSYATCSTPQA